LVLRELLIKLGLDLDAQSFAKGTLAAEAIKLGLEKIVSVATELAATLVENVRSTIDYADSLDDASQSTGIATDALQEFRYVAGFAGISADQMDHSLIQLSRSMAVAANGGEEQGKAFSKLGVSLKDGNGKLRDTGEVMAEIADGMKKLPDGAEKTALAMQLLGKSGAAMIPVFNLGADGIESMRQEARDLGLVLDETAIKAGAEVADNLDRLHAVTRGLWRSGIAPLLPAINELVKRFLEWQKANAAVIRGKIEKYIGLAVKAVDALADAFDFLIKNAEAVEYMVTAAAAAFVLLNTSAVAAAVATVAAWAIAAAPFLAIGAIIAGLLLVFDDFRVYQKSLNDPSFKGKSVFGLWVKALDDWMQPRGGDAWFVSAIKTFLGLLLDARRMVLTFVDEFDSYYERVAKFISYLPPVLIARGAAALGGYVGDMAARSNNAAVEAQAFKYGNPVMPGMSLSPEDRVSGLPMAGPNMSQSYAEYVPPTQAGSGVYAPQMSVQMSITTQPGQSNEQIAAMVEEKMQTMWDSNMETSAAAR
jgi:hypothetical protein